MEKQFDVIIMGGSYAGLSAAMSLGRSLRKVLVIDSGNPCNFQTPQSHNFLTNDGCTPLELRTKAKEQVLKYTTVSFIEGKAVDAEQAGNLFKVTTEDNEQFAARKLVFATGVTDTIPNIPGFSECWGISVLHCPYCHGYEVKGAKTGIYANGDMAFELAKLIHHWTDKLTVYTNGTSTLNAEQVLHLNKHNIMVVENEIESIEHKDGYMQRLHFKDTQPEELEAMFTKLPFIQQCDIPQKLGCDFTEHGFIHVDKCMETSVPGVYAAGDCLTLFRSVANAVAAGNKTGAMINKAFIEEEF